MNIYYPNRYKSINYNLYIKYIYKLLFIYRYMVVYITLPDEVFVKLSEEASKKGMDGKTYIKKLLEQYVYSKVLFVSGGAVDLTPVLNKLESIESRLAKIEERLNNLGQRQAVSQ